MSNELTRISGRLKSIVRQLEEDEVTAELESALTITRGQLARKVQGFRAIMLRAESDIELAKKEKARLDEFIRSRQRIVSRLQESLLQAVTFLGRKDGDVYRLDVGTLRLSTRKSSGVVVDKSKLPVNYWRTPPVENVPDLVKIRTDIEAGNEVGGAFLEERTNLVIK